MSTNNPDKKITLLTGFKISSSSFKIFAKVVIYVLSIQYKHKHIILRYKLWYREEFIFYATTNYNSLS